LCGEVSVFIEGGGAAREMSGRRASMSMFAGGVEGKNLLRLAAREGR